MALLLLTFSAACGDDSDDGTDGEPGGEVDASPPPEVEEALLTSNDVDNWPTSPSYEGWDAGPSSWQDALTTCEGEGSTGSDTVDDQLEGATGSWTFFEGDVEDLTLLEGEGPRRTVVSGVDQVAVTFSDPDSAQVFLTDHGDRVATTCEPTDAEPLDLDGADLGEGARGWRWEPANPAPWEWPWEVVLFQKGRTVVQVLHFWYLDTEPSFDPAALASLVYDRLPR